MISIYLFYFWQNHVTNGDMYKNTKCTQLGLIFRSLLYELPIQKHCYLLLSPERFPKVRIREYFRTKSMGAVITNIAMARFPWGNAIVLRCKTTSLYSPTTFFSPTQRIESGSWRGFTGIKRWFHPLSLDEVVFKK